MTEETKQESEIGSSPHHAEALVLNCMDYRLVDDVTRYMEARGMRDSYDQVILAGAAIGALTYKRNAWGQTFWEHVRLARELHGIRRLIVIDHRDCGACKGLIDIHCADDPEEELAVHRHWMQKLIDEAAEREPDLVVEALFMELDGSVSALFGNNASA
ncbi:carbonic anhydrase [Pseudahrensia aquimaris]|uniref:Carbonic anhydrase n=1 Tax=Pseudahrensia aquimaris TaxID=744461 RepID=A0ABW3FB56_9HYPH